MARAKMSPGDQRDLHLLGQKRTTWLEPRSQSADEVPIEADDFRRRGGGR